MSNEILSQFAALQQLWTKYLSLHRRTNVLRNGRRTTRAWIDKDKHAHSVEERYETPHEEFHANIAHDDDAIEQPEDYGRLASAYGVQSIVNTPGLDMRRVTIAAAPTDIHTDLLPCTQPPATSVVKPPRSAFKCQHDNGENCEFCFMRSVVPPDPACPPNADEKHNADLDMANALLQAHLDEDTPRDDAHTDKTVSMIDEVMSAVGGLIFFQVGKTHESDGTPDLSSHFGAMMMMCIQGMFGAAQPILLTFPLERPIFIRENAAWTYSVVPYFVSKMITELPVSLAQSSLSVTIFWLLLGLKGNIGVYIGLIWAIGLAANSIALFVSFLVNMFVVGVFAYGFNGSKSRVEPGVCHIDQNSTVINPCAPKNIELLNAGCCLSYAFGSHPGEPASRPCLFNPHAALLLDVQARLLSTTGKSHSYVSGRSQSEQGLPWFGIGRGEFDFQHDRKELLTTVRRSAPRSPSLLASCSAGRSDSPDAQEGAGEEVRCSILVLISESSLDQ